MPYAKLMLGMTADYFPLFPENRLGRAAGNRMRTTHASKQNDSTRIRFDSAAPASRPMVLSGLWMFIAQRADFYHGRPRHPYGPVLVDVMNLLQPMTPQVLAGKYLVQEELAHGG